MPILTRNIPALRADQFRRLLPFSVLCLPGLLWAQEKPSDQKTPAFSRQATSSSATANLVTDNASSEQAPAASANTPASFNGASEAQATSTLGIPSFAAVGPQVRSPVAAEYPLQWGPFSAHPHLTYGFTYATGVLFKPGEPISTALNTVSPGISIVSTHLYLDYTPTLNYYSKGPYDDNLGHSVVFRANFGRGDWSFHLNHSYALTFYPLIETGTQTSTESHVTSFNGIWNYNEKVYFDFNLIQQIQDSAGFQGSRQWSTMDWANYRLTQHLSLGAGLGGGYNDVDIGSNSIFEQIQGRLDWKPSRRLSLDLNGGIEIRQFFDTPGSGNLLNPIMGANASYQLFDFTSLILTANRSVGSSILPGDIVETTSVSGGVTQRLLGRFNLSANVGYRSSNYRTTLRFFNQALQTERQEDYTYVSAVLGTTFLKKGNASVSYLHGDNQSTLGGFTYATDQFSFQVGYRF